MPSLMDMIGQMILVGFHGTTLSDALTNIDLTAAEALPKVGLFGEAPTSKTHTGTHVSGSAGIDDRYATLPGMNVAWSSVIKKQLSLGHIGGVILYGYNIVSPSQTRDLVHALRAVPCSSKPWVAVDVEGGRVNRLSEAKGFGPNAPSARTLASMTAEDVRSHYRRMSQTLADHGFNLNFAPVVDLHDPKASVIGGLERAYSADPAEVVRLARIVLEEHRAAGVATSLKHFPGHGLAHHDSHAGMVDTTHTACPEQELAPYQALVADGNVAMIMTAHVFNLGWDADYPATLSPTIIQEHLRKAPLNYDGVVVADDLHMGAIQDFCRQELGAEATHDAILEKAVLLAIQAGVDILMFSNNPNAARNVPGYEPDPFVPERVIAIVTKAVADGRLSRARIERSYQRIMALKQRFSLAGATQ